MMTFAEMVKFLRELADEPDVMAVDELHEIADWIADQTGQEGGT